MKRSWTSLLAGPALGLFVAFAAPTSAQVVRDGTIGPMAPGLVDTLVGPAGGTDYLIQETDGERAGDNLFHSFSQFDLTADERAVYQGDTSIRNLITRVTGGPSSIDGTIRSEIPGANLYFINPAGVLFGENAQLDLTGAFHVSTADRLLFQNGDIVEIGLAGTPALSIDQVAGFGFLDAPAPIEIRGSQLEVAGDSEFSLTGGDITVLGGRTDGEPGFVASRSGRVDLASLRSGGEVYLDPNGVLRVEGVTARGNIRIEDNVTVSTSGIDRNPFAGLFQPPEEGSGPVNIYGHDLSIVDADIRTLTVTDEDAGDVTIDLDGDLLIRSVPGGLQSGIIAGTGLVILPAPGETLDPFNPFTFLIYDNSTQVTITHCLSGVCGVRYQADGAAGDVLVRARNVTFEDGGRITARSDGPGAAGNIDLNVSDSITFAGVGENGERSGLSSTADGTGNPGQIRILSPTADLAMRDQAAIVIQNSEGSLASSTPGLIDIDAKSLDLSGDARIDTSTRGAGDGGAINITASDFIRLSGRTSDTEFTGITSLSQPGSTGSAGEITISATTLGLTGGAAIAANPVSPGALGDAGSIELDISDSIRLVDSSISTESENRGGGNIEVTFGQLLDLENSSITSSVTRGDQPGGNVTLTSMQPSAVVLANSRIVAEADQGFGGNILVEASLLLADQSSAISATSNVEGLDGVVETRAPDGSLIDVSQDLNAPVLEASALLDEPCAARRPGGANSLVVSSYTGLPVGVEAVLPAFLPRNAYARLANTNIESEAASAQARPGTALARLDVPTSVDSCLN